MRLDLFNRVRFVVALGAASLIAGAAAGKPDLETTPAIPADFKVEVILRAVGTKPIATGEILVYQGRVYQSVAGTKEIIVLQPAKKRLELFDLERKVQTTLTYARLDESLASLKKALLKAVEKREAESSRASRIEAKMTRDLIEPRFKVDFDSASNRLRLTNETVEVEAVGEADEDRARISILSDSLITMAKLISFRDPTDLPPFFRIESILALTESRKLRPTEMSFVLRLAGPPRKLSWTYRFRPALTERELDALRTVDRHRGIAPEVRYERYQRFRPNVKKDEPESK